MTDTADHLLDDDGATEVVADRPARQGSAPLDGERIAKAPASRGTRFTEAGRTEFLILRKQDQPPVRLALTQHHIFKALWALWQAKRTASAEDPGVTIAEVSARLEGAVATSSINKALSSMVQNGMVRLVAQRAGFRSAANRYYPSSAGVEAFAFAEVLGNGAFVQVGKTSTAWRRRDEGEPMNLFQHASLLRGGAAPAATESA